MAHKLSFMTELMQKVTHIVIGILIVLGLQSGFLSVPVLGLLALFVIGIVLYNYQWEKEALTRILTISRADANIPGVDLAAFLLGSWVVSALFTQQIALAAIMILTFADPIAHLVSVGFGGAVSKNSYLQATIASVVVGALAAWIYVAFFPALIAAVVAMLVEAGEFKIADHHIDDNFTIPVVAGIVLWLISIFMPLI